MRSITSVYENVSFYREQLICLFTKISTAFNKSLSRKPSADVSATSAFHVLSLRKKIVKIRHFHPTTVSCIAALSR